MNQSERAVGDEIPKSCELIEVHVTALRLLFNAIDPSPLLERDLDPKIEDFIVSWARSMPRNAKPALLVYVDEHDSIPSAEHVPDAVREFFRQRSLSSGRRLTQLFRVGRTSLAIGLVTLALAVVLGGLIESWKKGEVGALLRESVLIGGWVAMWRPLEIFLYDWWPIRAERILYDRLAAMPVRIAIKPGTDIQH